MNGEEQLKQFSAAYEQKIITKVNERVYHFYGYGHSNAIAVLGDTSIILIDTLDSDACARDLKRELERISDKPVKTLIYTHGHPDHRGGAGVFADTVEEIIAFTPSKPMMKHYDRLDDILKKRGAYQHGYGLNEEEAISQGIGMREGKERGYGSYAFLSPTTYYEHTVERCIDGVSMKMVRADGESDDQCFIWLYEDQVLCCGDNYYGCWPNLYAIRGTQYRDIAKWVDTLEEILTYDMVALLPGHTKPLLGNTLIKDQLGTFKDAIEYVLLITLDCMNQGMDMDACVQAVKLPPHMQEKAYVQEFYGTIEWSVKSIYTGYLGWFDGDPAHLLPSSRAQFRNTMQELIPEDRLLAKIQACMDQEEYQIALELLAWVDRPDLKRKALIKRAAQVTSANARHYLIACAKQIDREHS